MRMTKRFFVLATVFIFPFVFFQNCSFNKQKAMSLDSLSPGADQSGGSSTGSGAAIPPAVAGNSIEAQAITLLQNKCFMCHGAVTSGGVTKINDPAYLISVGQIVPGNPASSMIYASVSAGRMPLSSTLLTTAELNLLSTWITAGAQSPAAGTTTAPEVIPLAGNYKSLNANVFAPKCVHCHGATVAKGGVKLDTYTNVKKYVSGTSATASKLYKISVSGEMPPSPDPNLTTDELRAISDWITAGSANN